MAKVLVKNFIENYGNYAENYPLLTPTGSITNVNTLSLYAGLVFIMGSFAAFGLASRKEKKEDKKNHFVKLKNQLFDLFSNLIMVFAVFLFLSTSVSFGYFTDIFFSKDTSLNTKIVGLSIVVAIILFLLFKYRTKDPVSKTVIKRRKNNKISPLLTSEEEKVTGKTYKQKLYTIFGYLLLLSSISSIGYFVYIYFFKYKDQRDEWLSSLPEEAINDLNYMKDIRSLNSQLKLSIKNNLQKSNKDIEPQ